ncbi:MAG: TetR/AcrR family transcriptional regulator [Candidatus Izimaplasma sp.]|nr:TetR/AcrR family transcriptional regulator [Candidatus Izimaplasma bacterium]
MARTTKQQQVARKERIIEVASKRFLEQGFENTSTKAIAKEVGIAEGTLFNYFDSKTDLFFETIGKNVRTLNTIHVADTFTEKDVSDALIKEMQRMLHLVLKLPKRILGELALAAIKLAKKKPDKLRRYAEIDFQYMASIEHYFIRMQSKGYFLHLNPKLISEMIYSMMAYELMMYVYDASRTKTETFERINQKIYVLLDGRM